jgi:hypothetical protein
MLASVRKPNFLSPDDSALRIGRRQRVPLAVGQMTGKQEVDHLHGRVFPVSESPTNR